MKHQVELLIILLGAYCTITVAQNYGNWQQIDSLKEPRSNHSAIQLANGNVLVVGGVVAGDPKSCEIYNLALNQWSKTVQTNYIRSRHRLIILDSKRVLAVGSPITKSCEIYDPDLNRWILTDSLRVGRESAQHCLVKLLDGRILVIGGSTNDFPITEERTLKQCEIFDEKVGKWSIADSMKTRRAGHSATLLKDGRVLVTGGGSISCEIYDPTRNEWTDAAPMKVGKGTPTAVLLPDGNVMVGNEIYNPLTDTWTLLDSLQACITTGEAFVIDDRTILIVGSNSNEYLSWEIYDFIEFRSKYVEYVNTKSFSKTKIQLNDGRVFVSGGVTLISYPTVSQTKDCWIFDKNITQVDEESNQTNSAIFFQNYPNPFNGSTIIRFFIEKPSNVQITIYNVLGERVEDLMNERKEYGYHEIKFSPVKLPSGIYYCRITLEEKVAIKKLLFIK
jgi:hypothetical protein